ncbi:hypothetical protein [Allohahella sp. A8]|uniref:hypothetical protein n=1 Tax=Allohahella sp. A8 TaxID=3141461 RepID=UPI003A7FA60E
MKRLFAASCMISALGMSGASNAGDRVIGLYICENDVGIKLATGGWHVARELDLGAEAVTRLFSASLVQMSTQSATGNVTAGAAVSWCGLSNVKPVTALEITNVAASGSATGSTGGTTPGITSLTVEAETLTLSGYMIEGTKGDRIAVSSSSSNGVGSASLTSTLDPGTYNIVVTNIIENDGQSTLKLFVDGTFIETQQYALDTTNQYFDTLTFYGVTLAKGSVIRFEGKMDGSATRARIDKITIE